MPRLVPTPRFIKLLSALSRREPDRAERLRAVLKRLEAEPRHPALHFEKLGGSAYRSVRVTIGDRLILRQIAPDTFELIDVGDHDRMYHRYG
jgi:mRNA-degrading endonuclease YafQ of YafQ-DinJ toxin-antitoxin module